MDYEGSQHQRTITLLRNMRNNREQLALRAKSEEDRAQHTAAMAALDEAYQRVRDGRYTI